MRLNLNDIDRLITEEIAGDISPEDLILLQGAIANDPIAHQLWLEKHADFKDKDMHEWLNAKDEAPSVAIIEALDKKRRARRRTSSVVSAAAVLVVIIGAVFLYKPSSTVILAKRPTIELRLENGKVIDLSQEGKVQAGDISLSNQQKALTYSAGNNTEMATLSVPAGKDYKVTLSDGTEIFLNSASSLRFPISFNNALTREVSITGEAYLKVTKDPTRPFIVKMQESSVQVLGTEFNVNSYAGENPQVALIEGKVQFKAGKDSAVLKPGYTGVYSGQQIKTERFDAEDLLSWRKGIFLFNDKALEEVFKVVPRLFGQDIVIDNPAKGKEHFTGVFDRNKTIQKNLDVLKAYNGIDYSIDENNVIHIK
jgi:transmembrane sensor